jgi:hypothetical protein
VPICRCNELDVLHDVPADDYTGHLVKEKVEHRGERVHYRCPQTGRRWVTEFVADKQGYVSMQLRQVSARAPA